MQEITIQNHELKLKAVTTVKPFKSLQSGMTIFSGFLLKLEQTRHMPLRAGNVKDMVANTKRPCS